MRRPVEHRLVRWTTSLTLLGLAACSSDEPPPPPIQHAPPVAFDMPTGRLALGPITVDLPVRRGIGTYYRNVDCWVRVRSIMPEDFPGGDAVETEVAKVLADAKLKVTKVAGTDVAAAGGADYLLVATVPSAHADLCIDSFFNDGPADIDAQVALSWRLWSVKDRRVVYESTTTGTGRAKDEAQTINAGVMAAIDDATRQLLQVTATQQYLTYGRVVTPAVSVATPAAPPVPAGGAAPIPAPPAGFQRPVMAETLPPILVPVRAARPAGATVDAAAARLATVTVGGAGAGIVLGDGYILTAAAVLGDGFSVAVELGHGQTVDARVIRRDAESGVALIRVDAALPPALPVQPRRNAVGDRIYGVGPGGLVQGTISATRAAGGRDAVKLAGAVPGGPVIDAAGNVIGVLLPDGGFVSAGTVFRALQMGAQLSDE
jgi:hypothetical protein